MRRDLLLLGSVLLVGSCFEDAEPCPEGSEGCPCLELRCEDGLVCTAGTCRARESEADSSSEGSSADDDASASSTSHASTTTSSTTESSTTASSTTSSDTTNGSLPMTTATADGASTTDLSTSTATSDDESTATTTESTSETTTGPGSWCGDDILDPDEMCDGTPGCNDDCTLANYECNPLNNAPCGDGMKCSVLYDDDTPILRCLAFLEPPPGALHEGNCFSFEPREEWCDVGLACAQTYYAASCSETGTNCCVEFCDLRDTTFACAHPDDACVQFLNIYAPTGLAHLGYCALP